jgi:bifunctional non-homologous end joining protein LigD
MKDYIWLKPEIVAEIKFTEWTGGNVLRHPEFVDLLEDKSPEEVSRES